MSGTSTNLDAQDVTRRVADRSAENDDRSFGPLGAALDVRVSDVGGLNLGEVADHEHQVDQPECEPANPDGNKPDTEEDEARIEEQQGVAEQPEAIASTRVEGPLVI